MKGLLISLNKLKKELEDLSSLLDSYDSSYNPKYHYLKERYNTKIKEFEHINILIETMKKLQLSDSNE